MHFVSDPDFKHPFFKDIVRIDYQQDMPPHLINDYGYTYIMFCYGKFLAQTFDGQYVDVPEQLLKGTGDYFNVTAHAGNTWITFEIANHVLYNITGIPSIQSRNKLYSLNDFVQPEIIEDVYESLRDKHSISEIASVMDRYLAPFYKNWSKPLKSTPIVAFIYDKKGMITLADLRDEFHYSERTMERLFKREVGASPYRFICLVRFNYVIREIERQPDIKIRDLIAQYNYYDHSHFEKDFQKFLGQSVVDYKNEFNPLLTQALSRKFSIK